MIQPDTKISIDGKSLKNFEHVSLTQTINDHHHFEVMVDSDIIEKPQTHTLDLSKDWLGKPIVITFDEKEFLGTIVNVRMVHDHGYNGQLLISGYSKTILLEGGPHIQSWLEKDLGSIVKEVVQAGGVPAEVKPVYTTPFEYQVQYGETHFQFIQRLARQHNEWLYYDGLKLIFGKPNPGNPVELEYGADMSSISISVEAFPSKQSSFSYNALDDKKEASTTKDQVSGLNELGNFAFKTSKDLFGIVPNGFSHARVKDKNQIDALVKNKQGSALAKSNVLRGSSTKQGLTVGTTIKVSAAIVKNGEVDHKNYGEYIITTISHSATGQNQYSNHFEALPSGVELLPEPQVEMPLAQSQIATVLSNEDPKKKGRVQVQFQWQSGAMKTSWIRVMSPDAGKSDKVGVNRGVVFIPEKDDQVMVGFRYNDPNRPFVMGSMFSGTTGAGGSDANKIKSITTRSGSTIVFDDDSNDGSITITDAANNSVSLDGSGTVSVSANSTISLSTGSSSLTMTSEGDINLQGVNVTVSAETLATVESKDKVNINGTNAATMDSPKIATVSSAKEVNITGTSKTIVSSSASTEIQGTIIKLN